jgi:hypothetical protein
MARTEGRKIIFVRCNCICILYTNRCTILSNNKQIIHRILSGKIYSQINFVVSLLYKHPKTRLSAQEPLEHSHGLLHRSFSSQKF